MQKNHGTRIERMTGHVRQRGRRLAGMDFVGRDGLLCKIDCVSPLLESCTAHLPSTLKSSLSNPHPPPPPPPPHPPGAKQPNNPPSVSYTYTHTSHISHLTHLLTSLHTDHAYSSIDKYPCTSATTQPTPHSRI